MLRELPLLILVSQRGQLSHGVLFLVLVFLAVLILVALGLLLLGRIRARSGLSRKSWASLTSSCCLFPSSSSSCPGSCPYPCPSGGGDDDGDRCPSLCPCPFPCPSGHPFPSLDDPPSPSFPRGAPPSIGGYPCFRGTASTIRNPDPSILIYILTISLHYRLLQLYLRKEACLAVFL